MRNPSRPSFSSRIRRLLKRLGKWQGVLLVYGLSALFLAIVIPILLQSLTHVGDRDILPNTPILVGDGLTSDRQRIAQNQGKILGKSEIETELPTGDADLVVSATICVRGTLPDGTEVCASGVSIDPELARLDPDEGALVITNDHVVAQAGDNPEVQLGGEGKRYTAKLVRNSSVVDLALLQVPDAEFPVAPLADASPEEAVAVRAIGFPNNAPLTVKDSRLLGITQNCLALPPCLMVQQGTITHGNSGGPLEAEGFVIGINQGETNEEIAIPIEQVHDFLADEVPETPDIPFQFEPGFPGPGPGYPGGGYPGPGGYPGGGYPGAPPSRSRQMPVVPPYGGPRW